MKAHKRESRELFLPFFFQPDDESLLAMCELLGIEAKQMAQWFCNKKITAMAEVLVTPLSYEQASRIRFLCMLVVIN